ncbi:MAG TPA: TonB-dependent receptor [Vicinamibacterales bacterium]|nr:TonB-dependent receptor [Vicinamibacterales bacterium]
MVVSPRHHRGFIAIMAALLICLTAPVGRAQGVQTGTLRGFVHDAQGLVVPGVTIVVTSPALQGDRTVVTGQDGIYVLRTLPPGRYTVAFSLDGFESVTKQVTVPLGGAVEQDVALAVQGHTESVTVTAQIPAAIATPTVGVDVTHRDVDALASSRTLSGIAELSPGLTTVTPNTGQVSINGAFGFDSVFMVDGVDVNDNLFGYPQTLFIEDAIQEVQTLTSGIPAEYGRFTGGVVNAITKSGGNIFSGSLRLNLNNPSWSTRTPYEASNGITHPDVLGRSWEGTFGGPILKDRLWFFSAGRLEDSTSAQTFSRTGLANTETDRNRRGELKLTATVAPSQMLQGGYLNNSTTMAGRPSIPGLSIDPATVTTAEVPNWYAFGNYKGVLNSHLLAEAQYSERNWTRKSGGTDPSIVNSPFLALTGFWQYNAPYFDLSDPEGRNNRQLTGSLTAFFDKAGHHDLKTGYEWYRSQRTGGNSQSATNYVFHADYLTDATGNPVYDASQNLIPLFQPGSTLVESYMPQRNEVLNIDTQSVYAQDHWDIAPRLSADLGLRYEHVRSEDSAHVVGIDTQTFMPRLAMAYDIKGDGSLVAHATYGHYAGRYNENQIAANSNVGNPNELIQVYVGPAGQGRGFAPGFDPANYLTVAGLFPTANVSLAPGLHTPVTKEFTLALGGQFGRRGYAEATYVFRRTNGLIEDTISLANGTTDVVQNGADYGTFTNIVYTNSDVATRQYQGMVFEGNYRLRDNWTVDGNYTLMLQDRGNYEGEAPNQPGLVSIIGNYPEAFDAARSYPMGNLQDYQRHRLRVWTIYDLDLGQRGDVSFSGLWRVNSGQVFSYAATMPLTTVQQALLAAYPDQPGSQTVFFGGRGAGQFKGSSLFDVAVNYDVPVFRTLRPWVKLSVYNVFNSLPQIAWNTTVLPDPSSPKDSLGLPTGYILAPGYGQADSNADYPSPYRGIAGGRTFLVSAGLRF